MLASIIKETKEKQNEWLTNKINRHIQHRDKMRLIKSMIEEKGDGLIKLSMKSEELNDKDFLPNISVDNVRGAVMIENGTFDEDGELEFIKVCGIGLFSLMGEKHTIESFFKKIAPYLK